MIQIFFGEGRKNEQISINNGKIAIRIKMLEDMGIPALNSFIDMKQHQST